MNNIAAFGSSPRGGTVDRLVEGLRQGILAGRYTPGQRLIEAEVARDFGVSRGPLREAFRRLAAEGIVRTVAHRGAQVRSLSYEETIELYQIRSTLESLAARLAATEIDESGNRMRFETAIRPIWRETPRRRAGYLQENRQFHLSIFDICGNQELADLISQLQLRLTILQLEEATMPRMYRDSVLEHREIADAILRGDSDAAESAMRRHFDRVSRMIEDMPRLIFRPPQDRKVN